jgi:hypothetical protein
VGAFKTLTNWRKLRQGWQLQCGFESCYFHDNIWQALNIMNFILCKKCGYINSGPLKFQLPFDTLNILSAFCSSTRIPASSSVSCKLLVLCAFGTLLYSSMRHILFALHVRTHPSCAPVTYKMCMWVGIG